MPHFQTRNDGRTERSREVAERARGQKALDEPRVGQPHNEPQVEHDQDDPRPRIRAITEKRPNEQ
jgi:hypothetical protein